MKRFLDTTVDGLNTGILLLLGAVQSKPRDVSAHASSLFEASKALIIRYYIKRNLEDLTMAIKLASDGLSIAPRNEQRNEYLRTYCALLLEDFAYNSRDTLKQALQAYDDLDRRAGAEGSVS